MCLWLFGRGWDISQGEETHHPLIKPKSEFQDRPQIKYPRIKHQVMKKQSHIVPKIHKEIKTLLIHSCGTPTNKDLGGKTDTPSFQLKEMPFHRDKVNRASVLR